MQYQYDAQNTGLATAAPPESDIVRWQTQVSPIDGGLVVANDRVLCSGYGTLVALDAHTGEKLWRVRVGHDINAPPAVIGDTVYVTTNNGGESVDRGVVALSLEDGSKQWRAIPDVDITSSPTVVDDTVYVGSAEHEDPSKGVLALDRSDGTVQWQFEADEGITTPAVDDGTVYVGGTVSVDGIEQSILYGLDAETGKQLWRRELNGEGMNGAPTVVNDTVYVTRLWHLHAIDATDGTKKWSTRLPRNSRTHASVVATDDSIYVPAEDLFVAFDTEGNERWSVEMTYAEFAPTVAGDSIVVADANTAYCFDAEDGTELWRRSAEQREISDMGFTRMGSAPVAAGSVVYVPSQGGDIHALQNEHGS